MVVNSPCPPIFDVTPRALQISGLSVARGGVAVLTGIDVTVEPGQGLILRGPNGAGKTTLLRTLAGLQPPHRGTVAPDPEAMAYASHADGLKATLTVSENLVFWARVHGHGNVDPAKHAFDLTALANRPAGTLSAGQKRRLGLARMMVTCRPIWLLDEPTVSLDQVAVGLFAAAIRAHLSKGGIAVIATHIDLGLDEARILDITPYRTFGVVTDHGPQSSGFDDDDGGAFL